MIYLDTHVAVALYQDINLLSRRGQRLLRKEDQIAISPMVLLELALLYELRRIRQTPSLILHHLQEAIAITICSKDFTAIITAASELSWTRDPFDRIIVAQAGLEQDRLLTKDSNILEHYRRAVW